MEGISTSLYKGMKNYWRRKGYRRLNRSSSGRRRRNRVELASTSSSTRRRRFWRIKITPKIKSFKVPSPKKFFVWLRDAYVKMMLSFADSRVFASGFSGPISSGGVSGFGQRPLKEYDEKMIIEIYKTLVMAQQGHVLPQNTASASEIVASRRP